jgi:hypothetical protein
MKRFVLALIALFLFSHFADAGILGRMMGGRRGGGGCSSGNCGSSGQRSQQQQVSAPQTQQVIGANGQVMTIQVPAQQQQQSRVGTWSVVR